MFNRQFEGQHERFHLPVYEDLENAQGVKREETGKEEAPRHPGRWGIAGGADSRSATASLSVVLPMQFDGAMDSAPSPQPQPSRADSTFRQLIADGQRLAQSRYSGNHVRAAQSGEDVMMRDAGERLPTLDAVRARLAEKRRSNAESEMRKRSASEPLQKSAESLVPLRQSSLGERMEGARLASVPPTDNDTSIRRDVKSAQPGSEHNAWMQDIVLDARVAKDKESDQDDDRANNHRHKPSSIIASSLASSATASSSHFPKGQSARSYLAWVHHRQTRFPTAAPNYAECILVAKKLGRHPAKVFDEVIYHWGFETGNERSEWYKQNRLELLGEDPRFDEETIGSWQAWLKEGRDEKTRRRF